jgi:hypothetical protein
MIGILPQSDEGEERGGGIVMEDSKGGPLQLLCNDCLAFQLLAYNTFTQNVVIFQICMAGRGHISTEPMPSLRSRNSAVYIKRQRGSPS